MEDRGQKAVERIQHMNQQLSEATATQAIGEVVLQLHQRGEPVTTPALVARLLSEVSDLKPDQLLRLRNEAAARLLGWVP